MTAVLGPTNTGKTHFAIERMLGHRSGMIGFPLRLLARENYDRVVAARGAGSVALITGEEMIVPAHPRWFVCTVEAMPVDRPVAFLAIDEIQLCADRERGHVFTDRLLHARGEEETLLLGAETIRPLLRRLLPRVEFITRPRFSALSYAGHRKLTRLPPRSAVVAFSAPEVYGIAEQIRRQRGGTAVVLGALSPRTRNAQVELYQAGEVDYLVATDAIGMGLNMDIDHVAFARLSKFDGCAPRRLNAHELAQIAGRAGRHTADGSFGTTGEELGGERLVGGEPSGRGLDPEVIEAIENHCFEPLRLLMWRNHRLRFDSATALLRSLEERPTRPELMRMREADDHLALATLLHDPDLARLAGHPEAVRLLWEVCRIPDFRKILSEAHTRLLGQIYRHLRRPEQRLPEDWIAGLVTRLDRCDGDIDALVSRIAHVRTWTYVSHRSDWLADPGHWRDRTRAIEDRLSDALHQRLTQRFVDRRSALLVKTLKGGGDFLAAVTRTGEVIVEGHGVGELEGFRFVPDGSARGTDGRALMSAARRALKDEIAARLRRLESEHEDSLILGADGVVTWHGAPAGRLSAGPSLLTPAVTPLHDELLDPGQRERLRRRLERRVTTYFADALAPLMTLRDAELSGPGRGLAFQLVEGLGCLSRHGAAALVDGLGQADRRQLGQLGVRIGVTRLYLPALLKPRAVAARALLWAVRHGLALPTPTPPAGRVSLVPPPGLPGGWFEAIGYPVVGPRAIRADLLDRFERRLIPLARSGAMTADPALAQSLGAEAGELAGILIALGWKQHHASDGSVVWRPSRVRRPPPPRRSRPEHGPFAKLKELEPAP
ncbi:MAG: disulfide oxidoreductase [Azospirillum sp.]|nr:disulfide oxidoreductase [Azospirillum sp.]